MLKKYFLLGVMLMVAAWSTMAFASVTFVPKLSSGLAIAEPGDPLNFRIAHMWNGIFIPSVDVTGLLEVPASAVAASEISQQYQYGPSVLAIGFAAPKAKLQAPQHYEYGPAFLATGFAAPAARLQVSRQYEYGPALLATGFASPSKTSFGAFPNVPWLH
jgi:hypothetical protein